MTYKPKQNVSTGRKPLTHGRDAFLFLLPSLIGFIVFVLLPFVIIIYLTFFKYNVITPPVWNEYQNWKILLLDKRVLATLKNSFLYVVLLIPMHTILSLVMAFLVHNVQTKIGQYAYRTLFYFPTLISTASIAMVWAFILNRDFGLLNYFLSRFGVNLIPWLNSSFWVYPAIMLFSFWKFSGIYFLYFYIALQNTDRTFTEAAEIDGANLWQKITRIYLPLITPTIFFVLITQMIGTIQIFDEPYILTAGGPGDASRSISLYIYNVAFNYSQFGYASVISLILMLIVFVITLVQFKFSGWVNYER